MLIGAMEQQEEQDSVQLHLLLVDSQVVLDHSRIKIIE